MKKQILIIAGEPSGDLHGASLIRELKKIDSSISISGIGGDKMRNEGMKLLFHINQMAFLGFIEVIRHIPFINKVKKTVLNHVENNLISTAVLIDYPGFNLNLAGKLKENKVNVIYYISPQLWAWGLSRMKKIKKYISKMLVVFKFEETLYTNAGVNNEYVGHPLIEEIENYNFLSRSELNDKFGLDREREILLILPGSREQEIRNLFPVSIEAARKISRDFNLQVAVACSENINENIFNEICEDKGYTIIKGYTYDLLKHSRLGIIKSGTSTLEAGLFGLPMVVVYSTSYLTYLIGKALIKIDKIALVNIVAEEKIVEELIQNDVTSDNIYNSLKSLLGNPQLYSSVKEKLNKIKYKLGGSGASVKAAQIIYSYLKASV